MTSLSRLEEVQQRLGLNNRQMAAELRVSEHWYSKVINGHRPASEDLLLRLDDLVRRRGVALRTTEFEPPHLKSGGRSDVVREDPASGSSRYGLQGEAPSARQMPTRADCESYLRTVLDNAERDGAPENIPAIYHRLKKRFPLDEWEKKE